jgi:hypothetical protein
VRTTLKVLLATGTVGLACAGAAAALPPPGADYPWVQLPAWVGTGHTGVLSTASHPEVQPPASIPLAEPAQRPAIAGSSYPWVQLPAWIGTAQKPVPLPTVSYPWVQPPAWIPIQ